MKDDTISRQAVLKLLSTMPPEEAMTKAMLIQSVQQMDAAQPEHKRGKWEMLQMPISPPVYKCSVCGSHALQSMTGCLMNRHYEANLTNYCPNCGAYMGGGQDDTQI